MKKIIIICLMLIVPFVFLSCGKKKSPYKSNSKAADFSESAEESAKNWTNEDGVICIVFGYGFNEQNYYNQSIEKLGDIYGLNQNGGLIKTLLFPDDFKTGIKELRSHLEKLDEIKSIIFLGAPDETHLVLARIQDMYDGTIPYPVISLFPQDNVLGQESTCSLILDYERSSEEEISSTESSVTIGADAEQIFMNTVKFMANLNGALIKTKDPGVELKSIAEKIVGSDRKVYRYIDRGSGMQSLNHYTMESR